MRKNNPQEDGNHTAYNSLAIADFTELNNANDILSDEYRRMMFDTVNGIREYSPVEVFFA